MVTTAKLSSKGQIAIPKAIRDQVGLDEGNVIAISVHGGDLVLRKVVARSWRRWRGVLKGAEALREHEEEHRREIEQDAESP